MDNDNPVQDAGGNVGKYMGKAALALLGLVVAVALLALLNAWALPVWNFAVGVAGTCGAAWTAGDRLVLGVLFALACAKYLKS